jgi:hypothetical protein
MGFISMIKNSFGISDDKCEQGFDKKAQRIAATGLAVSFSIGALSLVFLSLKISMFTWNLKKTKTIQRKIMEWRKTLKQLLILCIKHIKSFKLKPYFYIDKPSGFDKLILLIPTEFFLNYV